VRATNDGLWDWNLVTDELSFSPRCHELPGYAPGGLSTRLADWIEYMHPDDRVGIVKVMRRAQRADQHARHGDPRPGRPRAPGRVPAIDAQLAAFERAVSAMPAAA
jgi:PAS domain-containing protein